MTIHHIMKLVKPVVVVFFCFFNIIAWAQKSPDDPKQAQIQQTLNNWCARSGIPGASLSILLPNQDHPVTFTCGVTAYKNGVQPKINTLFQAGSISKSFTSAILLQLSAEGKLNLDDPITRYLPQYSRWQNVTIRQLLNHTSGIFNYTETAGFNSIRKNAPETEFTPEELVHLGYVHQNYFPPGEGWKYSNTNYVLAGMILRAVLKQPIEKIMNYYLHGGLKINLPNTFYQAHLYNSAFISRMAHGYSCDGKDVTSDNMSWAYTAGAIVTTTEDLITWWQGLFQKNILPSKQMSEMMTLVSEGSSRSCRSGKPISPLSDCEVGKGYGLGIIQNGYGSRTGTVWWHNGSTKGYKSIVMWYPKSNIYMALMINRDPGYLLKPNLPLIQHILNILLPNSNLASAPIKKPAAKPASTTKSKKLIKHRKHNNVRHKKH